MGDLAQFMVQNDLDDKKLVEKAGSLNLPGRSIYATTISHCVSILKANLLPSFCMFCFGEVETFWRS